MRRPCILGLAILLGLVGCSGSRSTPTGAKPQGPQATVTVRSAITGKTRWTAKIPGKCGQVEATGTKYFVINKRVFDRRTGRVLWRPRGWSGWGATMGTSGEHAPVANGPALVVARKGTVEGRSALTGRVRWTIRQPWIEESGISVGPTTVVAVQRFVPGSANAQATAWDRASGHKKWSAQIPAGSVSVTPRALVIVESAISRVQGLDVESGAPRWWTWLPRGQNAPVGVGSGVAVVQGPDGIEAFDDASGSHLWSIPGLDRFFIVQPESGVVAVHQFNNPTVRLVDLRSGVERAEVAENQSNIFPLSSRRVVRAGRARYDSVGADGRVFWTVARPDPAEGEDVWFLGTDLVTISDHCDQG